MELVIRGARPNARAGQKPLGASPMNRGFQESTRTLLGGPGAFDEPSGEAREQAALPRAPEPGAIGLLAPVCSAG